MKVTFWFASIWTLEEKFGKALVIEIYASSNDLEFC